MLSGLAGQRPRMIAVARASLVAAGLLVFPLLTACTTVEGTNAMTDIGTFERDVMSETLRGVGMLDREQKPETENRRGPLVLPKDDKNLPAPQDTADADAAQLPVDSAKVEVATNGLSDADIKRLRNVKVVEPHSSSGRPLTQDELAKLIARAKDVRVDTGPRPLYFPPEQYFTTVKGQDLVCLAANGELVPLTDKSCPPEVRKSLESQVH